MALPNLSALRLAEAERRVDTEEWVQYDPSLQRVIDDEDLRECPISAEKFEPGQWLWETDRAHGGKYYNPKWYWESLKRRNGVDPMMSDVPVSYEDVKKLVEGPQVADRDRDYIDDPPNERQLKKLYAEWRAAREARARGIRVEDGEEEEEDEDERREREEEEWAEAVDVAVGVATWEQWLMRLIYRGLTQEDIQHLFNTFGAHLDPLSEPDPAGMILEHLEIDQSFIDNAGRVGEGDGGGSDDKVMHWFMPFYTNFDWPIFSHEPGVIYKWTSWDESFRIDAKMHVQSQLARLMESRLPDDAGTALDVFRKVILRALIGVGVGGETAFLDELTRFVAEAECLDVEFEKSGDVVDFDIRISAPFMAWLCQERRGDSGPTEMPSSPLPRPAHASVISALADTDPSSTPAWGDTESKRLWELALDKMSKILRAVIEDTLRTAAPRDTRIAMYERPVRPAVTEQPPVEWVLIDEGRPRVPMLRATRVPWYAVPTNGWNEM